MTPVVMMMAALQRLCWLPVLLLLASAHVGLPVDARVVRSDDSAVFGFATGEEIVMDLD